MYEELKREHLRWVDLFMRVHEYTICTCVCVRVCMLWSIRDNSVYCDTRNAVTAAGGAAAAGAFVVVALFALLERPLSFSTPFAVVVYLIRNIALHFSFNFRSSVCWLALSFNALLEFFLNNNQLISLFRSRFLYLSYLSPFFKASIYPSIKLISSC